MSVLLLPRIWPAIILLYQIEASMIRKGRKIKEYEQRNKKLENSRKQHTPQQNRTEQNSTQHIVTEHNTAKHSTAQYNIKRKSEGE